MDFLISPFMQDILGFYLPMWGVILAGILLLAIVIAAIVLFVRWGKKKPESVEKDQESSAQSDSASTVTSQESQEEAKDSPVVVTLVTDKQQAETPLTDSAEVAAAIDNKPSNKKQNKSENEVKQKSVKKADAKIQQQPADSVPLAASLNEKGKSTAPIAEKKVEPLESKTTDSSSENKSVVKKTTNTQKGTSSKSVGEKKSAPQKPAKSQESTAAGSGKFIIFKRNDSYLFALKANNGQLLLESKNYTSRDGVKRAINTLKKNIDGNFVVDNDKTGKFRFVLYSAGNQMLFVGENYATKKSCENAINSTKRFAMTAVTVDITEE